MDNDWTYLLLLLLLIVCCIKSLFSMPRNLAIPQGVYLLSYTYTTVIGSVWISWTDGEILDAANYGLRMNNLGDLHSAKYYALLSVPFFVPLFTILGFHKFPDFHDRPKIELTRRDTNRISTSLSLVVALAFLLGFTLTGGLVSDWGGLYQTLQRLGGAYTSVLLLRVEAGENLPSYFYWMIYSGLPTLCFLAVALVSKSRSPLTVANFALITAGLSLLDLLTFHKAPILLLFLGLTIALLELELLPRRVVLLLPATVFFLLSIWMASNLQLEGGKYGLWNTWLHTILRMSHAYPYYCNLYPQLISGRVELPLNDIGALMYSQTLIVTPFMTASSHILAWSTSGWPAAVISQTIVIALSFAVGRVRRFRDNPFGFALYIEGLVIMYYCSQTNVIECLIGGVGWIWGAGAITAVAVVSRLLAPPGVTREDTTTA